jgi:hypothetical protein
MKCSAVATADSVECLRKQFVQISSGHIEVGSIYSAMQRTTYYRHCFLRTIQSQQRFTKLDV